jgi:glycosyltransferase involved in cell wall biosynthesis
MRIAIISTMGSAPWGGSEELWAAAARAALTQGHDVAIATYKWPKMHPRVVDLQRRGARLFMRQQPKYPRVSALIARLLPSFRAVLAWKPDIICISQGATYDVPLNQEYDTLLRSLRGGAFPYIVICQFNSDAHVPMPSVRDKAIEYFSRAGYVAFVSRNNLRVAERQIARRLPNAIVLRNPVNLSDTAPVPWPESQTVRIACVARLEVLWKGQDVLFEALGSPAWRGRDWRLSICGEGPDREYLESLARYYDIAERVDFLGQVADVRAIWADHHLLVLPSRGEGSPLALMEAMLCGRPSIVTDVGGNKEWVEDGQSGFIAEIPQAHSLSAAVERAWAARAQWESMGLRAHYEAMNRIDPRPGKTLLNLLPEAARLYRIHARDAGA